MRTFPIVRASYLNLYLDFLREVGAPVDRGLAAAGLPGEIEDMPEAYVSIARALEAVAYCGGDTGLMELGFCGSRRLSMDAFSAPMRQTILQRPTLHARLQAMMVWVCREDNVLIARMEPGAGTMRVVLDLPVFKANPLACLGEWVNVAGIVAVVRSVAGPSWSPPEIAFTARMVPCDAAQEHFGKTRFLTGQPQTSVCVEAELLARACPPPGGVDAAPGALDTGGPADWTFPAVLRAVIRPYLSERRLDVNAAAELVGMSGRTLQRRLQRLGTNYLAVVDEARGDLMRHLLTDPSLKIIDVGLMCGYDDPQNFTRTFGRIHGITPSAFRRNRLHA